MGGGVSAPVPTPDGAAVGAQPSQQVAASADPSPMATSATVSVTLPADSVVIVNGKRTQSTGVRRIYTASDMEYGRTYKWTIQAQFSQNGEAANVTREVYLRAGDNQSITLGNPQEDGTRIASRR